MRILKHGKVNDIIGFLSKDQPLWHWAIYNKWKNMWDRVYGDIDYFGCTIQPKYKYLSGYIEDVMKLDNFDKFKENPKGWTIDKDIKGGTFEGYYFQYLSIVTNSDNSKDRNKRNGNPNGRNFKPIIGISIIDNSIIIFKSINDCKAKGFTSPSVIKCLKSRAKSHKGYKWYYFYMKDRGD